MAVKGTGIFELAGRPLACSGSCVLRFALYVGAYLLFMLFLHLLARAGVVAHGPVEDACLALFFLPLFLVIAYQQARNARMAAALARDREFFGQVMDCGPALCVTGLDYSIRYANRAYLEMFHPDGRPPRHCYDSRPGEYCRSPRCPLSVLQPGGADEVVYYFSRPGPDGTRTIMQTACPLLDRDGRMTGVVTVFTDVTRTRNLEEKAREHRRLTGLATLAGGIAHDFNNLLTVVFGNQELAAAVTDDPRVREALADSARALRQARKLSGRLLLLAGSGVAPGREVGDLVPLAEDAFRDGFGGNGRLRFDRGESLPRVSFSPRQMEEAFSALGAALRDRIGDEGDVLFRSRGEELAPDNDHGLDPGQWLVIRISDTAPGLEREVCGRIFDPYFHTTPLDSRKGAGLEMALAYSVVKRHGGLVTVDSHPAAGTLVTVMLPAAGPRPGEEPGLPTARVRQPAVSGRGSVFILDDDENVAAVVSELAARLGYSATAFTCGRELAAAYAATEPALRPALVLLDLIVPTGLSGLATLRRLQEICPGVRAVAMSGRTDDEIMHAPESFGFAAALKKPFSLDELEAILTGR